MYYVYYKILFSLAYPFFSYYVVTCNDCTMYMSIYKYRYRSM